MKTFNFTLQYSNKLENMKQEHRNIHARRLKLELNGMEYQAEAEKAGRLMTRIMDIENGFEVLEDEVLQGIYKITIERFKGSVDGVKYNRVEVNFFYQNDTHLYRETNTIGEESHCDFADDIDLREVTKDNYRTYFKFSKVPYWMLP